MKTRDGKNGMVCGCKNCRPPRSQAKGKSEADELNDIASPEEIKRRHQAGTEFLHSLQPDPLREAALQARDAFNTYLRCKDGPSCRCLELFADASAALTRALDGEP